MKKMLLLLFGVLVFTGALFAETIPNSELISPSALAMAVGYPGTLKIESVDPGQVYPPGTAIWCMRVYSDNNTFPELEVFFAKGKGWSSQLREQKKILENAKAQEYKWAEAKKLNPEYFPEMGRIVVLIKSREGVITALPGMGGTGVQAIMPGVEEDYSAIVRTKYGIEQTAKGPKTEEFHSRLAAKTMDVMEAIVKEVDKVLFE